MRSLTEFTPYMTCGQTLNEGLEKVCQYLQGWDLVKTVECCVG